MGTSQNKGSATFKPSNIDATRDVSESAAFQGTSHATLSPSRPTHGGDVTRWQSMPASVASGAAREIGDPDAGNRQLLGSLATETPCSPEGVREPQSVHQEQMESASQELINKEREARTDAFELHKRTLGEIEARLHTDLKALAHTHAKNHGDLAETPNAFTVHHPEKHEENADTLEDMHEGGRERDSAGHDRSDATELVKPTAKCIGPRSSLETVHTVRNLAEKFDRCAQTIAERPPRSARGARSLSPPENCLARSHLRLLRRSPSEAGQPCSVQPSSTVLAAGSVADKGQPNSSRGAKQSALTSKTPRIAYPLAKAIPQEAGDSEQHADGQGQRNGTHGTKVKGFNAARGPPSSSGGTAKISVPGSTGYARATGALRLNGGPIQSVLSPRSSVQGARSREHTSELPMDRDGLQAADQGNRVTDMSRDNINPVLGAARSGRSCSPSTSLTPPASPSQRFRTTVPGGRSQDARITLADIRANISEPLRTSPSTARGPQSSHSPRPRPSPPGSPRLQTRAALPTPSPPGSPGQRTRTTLPSPHAQASFNQAVSSSEPLRTSPSTVRGPHWSHSPRPSPSPPGSPSTQTRATLPTASPPAWASLGQAVSTSPSAGPSQQSLASPPGSPCQQPRATLPSLREMASRSQALSSLSSASSSPNPSPRPPPGFNPRARTSPPLSSIAKARTSTPMSFTPRLKTPTYFELSVYFASGYLRGATYEGSSYEFSWDSERSPILHHKTTDISVWAYALDVRKHKTEMGLTIFHYIPEDVFLKISAWDIQTFKQWAAHAESFNNFGFGLYGTCKEPAQWASVDEILMNNHWPSQQWLPEGTDSALQLQEHLDSPVHHQVREKFAGCANFCVPIICDVEQAFDIQTRATLEMEAANAGPGQNIFGEREPLWRDVWVVRISEGLDSVQDLVRSSEELAEMMWKQIKWSKDNCKDVHLIYCSCFARLLEARGRFDEAVPLFREEIQGWSEKLGETHPTTLGVVNHLGRLLQAKQRFAEAEPLFRTELKGWRLKLGDKHPDILARISGLAQLLHVQGRLSEAEDLYRQALEGRREELGAKHPDTLQSINSLVLLLNAQGRLDEATGLYRETLTGWEVTWEGHESAATEIDDSL